MPPLAGYSRLPLQQFNLEKYLGTWHQYGSIRPWYQPNVKNVVLSCTRSGTGEMKLDIRLEHLLLRHCFQGKITLGPILPNFTIHTPKALLGFGLVTDFTVRAVLVNPQGQYTYILCTRKGTEGLHLMARTLPIPVAHQIHLHEVLQELGYDASKFQLS